MTMPGESDLKESFANTESTSALMAQLNEVATLRGAYTVPEATPVDGSALEAVNPGDPWSATFSNLAQNWWSIFCPWFYGFPYPPPSKPDFDLDPVPAPILDPIPEITDVTIPEFDGVKPDMDIPPAPEWTEYPPPGKPAIVDPPRPDKPPITFPDVPVFAPIPIPEPLGINLPTFDATWVDEDLIVPTYRFNYTEKEYTSDLKDAIQSGLLTEIQTGGYGLNPNDETLLWQRAREREDFTAQKAIEEVKRNFSMTGFPIPVGAMTKQMEKAVYEAVAKGSSINRDITLKRSELYFEGKKFAFTSGIQLETMNMNLWNQVQERCLNAAKAEMELLIAHFNVQISRYNARLTAYKVQAEVFHTQIQAEIAKVEIFKAQIQAALLQGEVQKNQVELYNAQVKGVQALIDAYKADVEVLNSLMLVEKTKMEVYRAEVEAYAAQVAAEKNKFEAYDSKIKGEIAKMEGYGIEAKAYSSMVDGKKSQIEAKRLQLQAYIDELNANIMVYKLQVDQKKDIRDVQKDVLAADVTIYNTQVKAWETRIEACAKMAEVEVRAMEASARLALIAMELAVEQAKIAMTKAVEAQKCATQLSIAGIEARARTEAARLGQFNESVSVATHYQRSESETHSDQRQQSIDWSERWGYSDSFSINHNYHHTEG